METKISKIEDFLVSLEQEKLTEQQSSMMLQAGPPGSGGDETNYICPTNLYCPPGNPGQN